MICFFLHSEAAVADVETSYCWKTALNSPRHEDLLSSGSSGRSQWPPFPKKKLLLAATASKKRVKHRLERVVFAISFALEARDFRPSKRGNCWSAHRLETILLDRMIGRQSMLSLLHEQLCSGF